MKTPTYRIKPKPKAVRKANPPRKPKQKNKATRKVTRPGY